jgi:hypothetical protein
MLGKIHGGGAAFTYLFPDCIASDRSSDHLFSRHAAKLTETRNTG